MREITLFGNSFFDMTVNLEPEVFQEWVVIDSSVNLFKKIMKGDNAYKFLDEEISNFQNSSA